MKRAFLALLLCALPAAAHAQSNATLHLVFVLDGLRPDSIDPVDTPNLYRLRKEGVAFEHPHAVFPTVTRVNAASLGSGVYPARHGIMGNSIFVPAVDPKRAFTNDSYERLLKLDEATSGRMVTATGIAERMQAAGRSMVVVSSGSTGSALLLAPKAHRGTGIVIHGDFAGGAYPPTLGETIVKRFGPAPKKGGARDPYDKSVDWALDVLREHVIPDMKPAVVYTWLTEPDHIQHGVGVGSPPARASIRNDDRHIGGVLAKLDELGIRDKTNVIVVSDHGFGQTGYVVNVTEALTVAGFVKPDTDDVVIASSGQAIALHVKGRDAKRIAEIVQYLQGQAWCGVVFTAGKRGGPEHEGSVAGTFSLEYVHLGGHERSPDVVFTFPWSSALNRYGMRGGDYNQTAKGRTGPTESGGGNHGGIGPWTVRNTMLAWGPDFKRSAVVRTPSSNVDVAPTLMHLLGIPAPDVDGRPLLEALVEGPDQEQVAMETRTLRVANGAYRAVLQVSITAGKRYVDKAWKEN